MSDPLLANEKVNLYGPGESSVPSFRPSYDRHGWGCFVRYHQFESKALKIAGEPVAVASDRPP